MIDRPTDPRPGREDEIRRSWARRIGQLPVNTDPEAEDVRDLLGALDRTRRQLQLSDDKHLHEYETELEAARQEGERLREALRECWKLLDALLTATDSLERLPAGMLRDRFVAAALEARAALAGEPKEKQ